MSGLINLYILHIKCILIETYCNNDKQDCVLCCSGCCSPTRLLLWALPILAEPPLFNGQSETANCLQQCHYCCSHDAWCVIGSWWAMLNRSSAAEMKTAEVNDPVLHRLFLFCEARKGLFFFPLKETYSFTIFFKLVCPWQEGFIRFSHLRSSYMI